MFILKKLSSVKKKKNQNNKKVVFHAPWLVTEGKSKSVSTGGVEVMGQGKGGQNSEKNCWSKAPSKWVSGTSAAEERTG